VTALSATVGLEHGVVLDATLRAEPGITILFGASGAGKTTFLHAILGAARPLRGRITVGARVVFDAEESIDLPIHRRRVGIVFQEALLFPHRDARGNVAYGARGSRSARSADLWLEKVGAAALASKRPREMSGGERQRVALARALCAEPEVLLLDEPFASLDQASRESLGALLLELVRESPIPFVHVTHDPAEAVRLGDAMVILDHGRVTASGLPVEILAPGGAGSAAAGSTNWLKGSIVEDGPDGGRVDLGGTIVAVPRLGRAPGSPVVLALPAEEPVLASSEIRGTSARNVIPGTVVSMRDGGDGVEIVVATPVPIRVRVTRGAVQELGLVPGARVWLLIKAQAFRRTG
jgi:molybdate transport system ATP-binding protein